MDWMLMPLRRYADFSGRSRRMEFWMWQLFQFIVYFVVVLLAMVFGGGMMMMAGDPSSMAAAGGGMLIIMLLYLVYALAVLVPSIAVAVRRLHDTNRSGWWILAPVAPYVVAILAGMMAVSSPDMAGAAGILALICMLVALALAITLLVFYFLEGTRGPNKYGPDPKGQDTGQVFA
ncbi:MAG TPA: DUF805 domain-containing protein [Allosphingosinicella sp.]|nr:DUF805 domain-containing protein [Allosphingosinicella sp.]